jgi:hypothetical protein
MVLFILFLFIDCNAGAAILNQRVFKFANSGAAVAPRAPASNLMLVSAIFGWPWTLRVVFIEITPDLNIGALWPRAVLSRD